MSLASWEEITKVSLALTLKIIQEKPVIVQRMKRNGVGVNGLEAGLRCKLLLQGLPPPPPPPPPPHPTLPTSYPASSF